MKKSKVVIIILVVVALTLAVALVLVLKKPKHVHEIVVDAAAAPMCTETGLTEGKHCSVCGEVLIKQEIIAVKGHDMAAGVCRVCGYGEGELEYALNSDQKSCYVSGIGTYKGTKVVIQSEYRGFPVTSIGNGAFYDCKTFTSITIPDSVTSIGHWAFRNCIGLTSITIPDSVTSIGERAFYGCPIETATIPAWAAEYIRYCEPEEEYFFDKNESKLKTVVITSGTSIGNGAFAYCRGLTSITIPNSVASIGVSAFFGCKSLTSITIPDSVTSIGERAFYDCTSLESITVEDGNKYYHSDGNCLIMTSNKVLVAGCKNSVIPDDGSVTSICEYAFYKCTGLTSITIPDSVTSIGDSAFLYCNKLETITFKGTEGQWNAIAKGTSWDSNAGSKTSGRSYKLVFEK